MNDHRDKLKNINDKSVYAQGQGASFNSKNIENKEVYAFVLKKSEKIVTALYLVTDCFDAEDALKIQIRKQAVSMLSDMNKMPVLSGPSLYEHVSSLSSCVSNLSSLVSISFSVGFISEMNTIILQKEFSFLSSEIDKIRSGFETSWNTFGLFGNRKVSDLVIDSDMLRVDENVYPKKENIVEKSLIENRDKVLAFRNKMTENMSVKLNGQRHILSEGRPMGQPTIAPIKDNNEEKNKRVQSIKDILKDKRFDPNGEGVSIKDISSQIKDCSEKTIQRDLNNLIATGEVKKTGEKRWSRYQTISG